MIGNIPNHELSNAVSCIASSNDVLRSFLQPGDRLSEVGIATELAMAARRFALLFPLSKARAGSRYRHKAVPLRGLSDIEITEILEARLVLESYLAGRAAIMISDAELIRLETPFLRLGNGYQPAIG